MLVGILGGGLAGLSVAAHLDHPCEVLEQEERCGGHCRSASAHGFTYDIGGPHILYSRDQPLLEYIVAVLESNIQIGRRTNKIWYRDRYVKYPFENGLFDLVPQERFECLYHFLHNPSPAPANFRDWLYFTFGKGITEKYLLPYNEKIWKTPAAEMAFDWVEGRVPQPPLEDLIKSAVGLETEGYLEQLNFHYPKRGGIEALPRALLAKTTRVLTGFRVRSVRRRPGGWIVGDGQQERSYDRLVATIALPDLIEALDDVPPDVRSSARALRFNSLVNVALGLRRSALPNYTAVYVPDPSVLPHRLSFPANFSQENVPPGRGLINAEITAQPDSELWQTSDADLVRRVTTDLAGLEWLDPSDVCFSQVHRSRHAYVINDFGYRKNLDHVMNYCEGLSLPLCGRLAQFEYINMDTCIERGRSLAQLLNREGPVTVAEREPS